MVTEENRFYFRSTSWQHLILVYNLSHFKVQLHRVEKTATALFTLKLLVLDQYQMYTTVIDVLSGLPRPRTQTLPVTAARDALPPGGQRGARGSLLPRAGYPDRAGRAQSGTGAATRAHLPEARPESGPGRRAGNGRASSRRSAGGDPEPGRSRRPHRARGAPDGP